jgi:hypothetical protein
MFGSPTWYQFTPSAIHTIRSKRIVIVGLILVKNNDIFGN